MSRKWVEGDRLECNLPDRLTAVVIRHLDGVVLRLSNSSVMAGSQKNLSAAGWQLKSEGYNPEIRTTPES